MKRNLIFIIFLLLIITLITFIFFKQKQEQTQKIHKYIRKESILKEIIEGIKIAFGGI